MAKCVSWPAPARTVSAPEPTRRSVSLRVTSAPALPENTTLLPPPPSSVSWADSAGQDVAGPADDQGVAITGGKLARAGDADERGVPGASDDVRGAALDHDGGCRRASPGRRAGR